MAKIPDGRRHLYLSGKYQTTSPINICEYMFYFVCVVHFLCIGFDVIIRCQGRNQGQI